MATFTISEWADGDVASFLPHVQRYHDRGGFTLVPDWQTQLQTLYDNRATNKAIFVKAESGTPEFAGLMVFGQPTNSPMVDDGLCLELWAYYVRPKFKGQGVVRDMVADVKARATAASVSKLIGMKRNRTATTKMQNLQKHMGWKRRGQEMVFDVPQS